MKKRLFLLVLFYFTLILGQDVLFCKTNYVNVRTDSNVSSEILGQLSINDSIIPVDSNGQWFKINYKGKEAYVFKVYISKNKIQAQKYWINSKSGVLHNSSCRWFGNTQNGYFTEKELGRDCKICGGAYRIQKLNQNTGNGKTYWINTNSGVRHNSSCRWFGSTKHGYFADEKEGRACKKCGG